MSGANTLRHRSVSVKQNSEDDDDAPDEATNCALETWQQQPDGAGTEQDESEERWRANCSMILSLHMFSSASSAFITLAPGVLSGCPASAAPVLFVLVAVPGLEWLVNWGCHRRGASKQATKLALAPLLTFYYCAIVLYDLHTHVMEYSATPRPYSSNAVVAECAPKVQAMSNHRAIQEELVDLSFNFFMFACILESWRSRALLVAAHFIMWACDNLTYDDYRAPPSTTHQVVWNWTLFCLVEATQMATALIITVALDKAQRAQVELDLRAKQLEEEKERLEWEMKLREHFSSRTAVNIAPYAHSRLDAGGERALSSCTSQPLGGSHHTCKLGQSFAPTGVVDAGLVPSSATAPTEMGDADGGRMVSLKGDDKKKEA